ncbi:MAG: sulfatase-like hydrolase/transferase, partial [FCB group bacterium]|nr:sulfatase-like hydrolase/transferase [FCB group bacterium]
PNQGSAGSANRRYDSEVAYADHYIGKLLDALPKENAFVIFCADHGESLYEHDYVGHGRRIYQTCMHVPLILRGPSITPGRDSTPARLLDVMPTLLAATGLPAVTGMFGRNLLAPQSTPQPRFIETYGGAVPHLPGAKAIMADRPPMRQGVVLDGWKLILNGRHAELYRLPDDPMEKKDLAEQNPGKVEELTKLVNEFDSRIGKNSAEQAPLTPDDIEALKSLGYVN